MKHIVITGATGMIVANRISVQRKILDDDFAKRIENVCLKILNLELKDEWFDFERIISAIRKDKKQTDSSVKAVLVKRDFSLTVVSDVTEKEIFDVVVYLKEILGA